MKFCNIDFNITNKRQLFERNDDEIKCITTVNAQIIVLANKDSKLMRYINTNYATVDGEVPFKIAKLLYPEFRNIEKLSGSDIVYDFCAYAKENDLKVFFLGGQEDSNKRAVENIKKQYDILVEGYSPDFENYPFSQKFISTCMDKIEKFQPDILFVGFGAPKQEYFIYENKKLLKENHVKFVLGSGGTVDFVSGKIERAPLWIRNMGLEGIYRLFREMNYARLYRLFYSFKFLKYINKNHPLK